MSRWWGIVAVFVLACAPDPDYGPGCARACATLGRLGCDGYEVTKQVCTRACVEQSEAGAELEVECSALARSCAELDACFGDG